MQTDFDHFKKKFRPTETRYSDAFMTSLILQTTPKSADKHYKGASKNRRILRLSKGGIVVNVQN